MSPPPTPRKPTGKLATVTIAGNDIEIHRVADLIQYEGSDCWGLFQYEEHKILIYSGLSEKQEVEVLIHELTHAAAHYYHLGLPEREEERLCDVIGSALAAGLKPWLGPIKRKRQKK